MMRAGETRAVFSFGLLDVVAHQSAFILPLLPLCVFVVLCAQVCKVYRFQTEDQRWLLVREQMSETPLSFSLPKQLLSALIQEHRNRCVFITAS